MSKRNDDNGPADLDDFLFWLATRDRVSWEDFQRISQEIQTSVGKVLHGSDVPALEKVRILAEFLVGILTEIQATDPRWPLAVAASRLRLKLMPIDPAPIDPAPAAHQAEVSKTIRAMFRRDADDDDVALPRAA